MSVEVLEIHHCALRVPSGGDGLGSIRNFYESVLGLASDDCRPEIPDSPGSWMNVGNVGQIHLIAVDGQSNLSKGPGRDPTGPHIAFAVASIVEAKTELDRLGVSYWTLGVLGGANSEQVFLDDGAGNLLELHQIDSCRCALKSRLPVKSGV